MHNKSPHGNTTPNEKLSDNPPQTNTPTIEKSPSIYLVSKTVIDYTLTIPSLLLLTPLILLIAVIIKLESPGPILNRRRAAGRNGKEFDAFTFRTTYVTGQSGGQFANSRPAASPKYTQVGRILQKYGLNELPQLINVLKRDMSLIGPRIISVAEAANGRFHQAFLSVYPGLTGLWQITRQNHKPDRIQLDLAYVEKWSIWLDLKILLLTIPAVLRTP